MKMYNDGDLVSKPYTGTPHLNNCGMLGRVVNMREDGLFGIEYIDDRNFPARISGAGYYYNSKQVEPAKGLSKLRGEHAIKTERIAKLQREIKMLEEQVSAIEMSLELAEAKTILQELGIER